MAPPAQATNGFADINGAQLYFEVAGSGPSLVLIHARIADSRMWDDNWQAFAAHSSVIRYDLRGHGKSAMPSGSFSHLADLAGLLAFLNVEQTCVLGSSMGGEIAIDFALQHPDSVSALVPVACAPAGYDWSSELVPKWQAIFAALEQGDFAGAVELELQLWVDGLLRQPNQVDQNVRERVRRMDIDYWQMLAEYRQRAQPPPALEPPAVARLDEIGVPTLVVVGDADVPDILGGAELLATTISTAKKVVVAGAGHMLTMEQPELFNQLVDQFLSKQG